MQYQDVKLSMQITKDFYNKDYFEGKNQIAYDS